MFEFEFSGIILSKNWCAVRDEARRLVYHQFWSGVSKPPASCTRDQWLIYLCLDASKIRERLFGLAADYVLKSYITPLLYK